MPSVRGVAALLVFTMDSLRLTGFCTSQVQPEPKLLMALFENCSLKLAMEPKLSLMASASTCGTGTALLFGHRPLK